MSVASPPHRRHAEPADVGFSLPLSGGVLRLAIAGGLVALLWLGVFWALH